MTLVAFKAIFKHKYKRRWWQNIYKSGVKFLSGFQMLVLTRFLIPQFKTVLFLYMTILLCFICIIVAKFHSILGNVQLHLNYHIFRLHCHVGSLVLVRIRLVDWSLGSVLLFCLLVLVAMPLKQCFIKSYLLAVLSVMFCVTYFKISFVRYGST